MAIIQVADDVLVILPLGMVEVLKQVLQPFGYNCMELIDKL